MNIRQMLRSDLDFAAECTAIEGWDSETRQELAGFLSYDPNGCFIAEVDNRRAGMCIATRYHAFGFIGELIVVKEMRGRGIGGQLLEQAIKYLHTCGVHNIFLDGVLAALPLYERAGFRRVCRSLRFAGQIVGREHPPVRAMTVKDLEAVTKLDKKAFGADRRFFLERRLALCPELCKIWQADGKITGFIMGRHGRDSVSAGPWIVQPDIEHPAALLESLAGEVSKAKLSIGILETNSTAVATVQTFGFVENPESPWRMIFGNSERLSFSPQSYAIGSPAKG